MLLLLFALAAHAQQYGGYGGAGTSVPQDYPASPRGVAALAPPADAQPRGPTPFQLRQANRNVAMSEAALNGDRVYYNLPLSTFGFTDRPSLLNLGTAYKADFAAQQERYYQYEIDHLRRTTPQLTRADRDKIDDFALQRDFAENQKIRRGYDFVDFSPFPFDSVLGPISKVYDVRARQDAWTLAQNALTDAHRAYQADPSRENYIHLKNARDGVAQADHREDAATYDLLGNSFGGVGKFGPIFRKKASETKLETGLRNLRVAREAYAKDPSEDNMYKLRLANVFVKATEEEDETNKNDIAVSLLLGGELGTDINGILSARNAEDESTMWLKYARLQRQQLYRQALPQGASPVAQQMLGLSMYGPRQIPY